MTEEKPEKPEKIPATPSQIAKRGLIVDVPMEASSPNPARLKYADLGEDKKWRRPDPAQDESGDDGEAQDSTA